VQVDNQLIDPVDPAHNGDAIVFSVLTSYRALDSAGVYKRVKLIRPDFLAQQAPLHSSQARYDFDIDEGTDFQSSFDQGAQAWDAGRWDESVWGSSKNTTFPTIGGGWGYGRYIAIATKGSSRYITRLVGWDVIYDTGGPLI